MCAGAPDREGMMRYGHRRATDATLLWSAVRRLRETGNKDPVHVFHVDSELPQEQIELIQSVPRVTVHDLKDSLDEDDLRGVQGDIAAYRSFYCKVQALLHSPFDETMMIDTDVLLFRDPGVIWDHPVMKEKGTFFFRDRKIGDGAKRCKKMQDFFERPAVKAQLKLSRGFNDKMWEDHRTFCEGDTAHEQDSSLVAVNKGHANAQPFLKMLKKFQNQYVSKDKAVKEFLGYGDKELYWLACDLAGVECGWNPRGRPMHTFFWAWFIPKKIRMQAQKELREELKEKNVTAEVQEKGLNLLQMEDDFQEEPEKKRRTWQDIARDPGNKTVVRDGKNVTVKKRQWISNGPRTCICQVQTDGNGTELLYANLDGGCDWSLLGINAVTNWNENNTDPEYSGNAWRGFEVWTGKGKRRLSQRELSIVKRFRADIALQEPDTMKEFGKNKEQQGWIARALDLQIADHAATHQFPVDPQVDDHADAP